MSVIKLASFAGPIDNTKRKGVFALINAWFITERIMPTCIQSVTITPIVHDQVEIHVLLSPLRPQARVRPIQIHFVFSPTSGSMTGGGTPSVEGFALDANDLLTSLDTHNRVLHRALDPVVYAPNSRIEWRLFAALVYDR